MIKKVDADVGYLLQQIQENGLENKTNIVIVSDHGRTKISFFSNQSKGCFPL